MTRIESIEVKHHTALEAIRSRLATDYETPAQRIINRGLEALGLERFKGGNDLWEMLEALRNGEEYERPPRHLLERWAAY